MNILPQTAAPSAAQPASSGPLTAMATGETAPAQRVAHLFRHALRDGRLHPLLHLMQQYRAEAGAGA